MPHIRPATDADVDCVVDHWNAMMKHHRRYVREVRATQVNRKIMRKHFAELVPHGQLLVLEDEAGVQGFVAIVVDIPKLDVNFVTATVSDLYVDDALRGHGWGEQLLDQAVSLIRERGLHAVRITVRAGNVPAKTLYRKKGFRPMQETLLLPLADEYVQFGPDSPEVC